MINACLIRYYSISSRCHFDTILVLNSMLFDAYSILVRYILSLTDLWFMHVKFDVVHCLSICIQYLLSLNISWQFMCFRGIFDDFSMLFWYCSILFRCIFHLNSIWWCFSLFFNAIWCLFDCIVYIDSYSISIESFYRLFFLLHFLIIFAIFCYGCQSCSVVLITLVEEFEGTWDSFRSWWETCQVWNWQDWTSDHFLKMCLIALGLFPHT